MKSNIKSVFVFIGLVGVILLSQELDILWYSHIEPKYENAKRKVFEETYSYHQGKIQELSKYQYEYRHTKDDTGKLAIKALVRHQFAGFNQDGLDSNLREFLTECNR